MSCEVLSFCCVRFRRVVVNARKYFMLQDGTLAILLMLQNGLLAILLFMLQDGMLASLFSSISPQKTWRNARQLVSSVFLGLKTLNIYDSILYFMVFAQAYL